MLVSCTIFATHKISYRTIRSWPLLDCPYCTVPILISATACRVWKQHYHQFWTDVRVDVVVDVVSVVAAAAVDQYCSLIWL